MVRTFMQALVLLAGSALLNRPAAAAEIDSFIYGLGGTEVAGGSYTELDYSDIYNYNASGTNVDSTLWVGEDQLDYEYAFGSDFAEDAVSGDGGSGWYTVLGDHWMLTDDGWNYVGETSASMELDEG